MPKPTDDELLAWIKEALEQADPVPQGFTEAAHNIFAALHPEATDEDILDFVRTTRPELLNRLLDRDDNLSAQLAQRLRRVLEHLPPHTRMLAVRRGLREL